MTAKERFEKAATAALESLDDGALETLSLTIEAHMLYKESLGYSASEAGKWKSELEKP